VLHTVDDGTDDLVNLSNEAGICACKPSSESRKSIGTKRLESATSHKGRSGKGSPADGPGEAAVKRRKIRILDQ
jgi:hypothetical protein